MTSFHENSQRHEDLEPGPNDTPPSLENSDVIRDLEAYCDALQRGDNPDRPALLSRYPEIATELEDCLEAMQYVRKIGPTLAADSSSESHPSALGNSLSSQQLGDYRLLREAGRGGMGVVYEAQQISLERRVALKVLPFAAALSTTQLQRFKNEALAAAAMDHPHIVHVYAIGCDRAVHFYAMQFIDGLTLGQVIGQLRASQSDSAGSNLNSEDVASEAARSLLEEVTIDPDAARRTVGKDSTVRQRESSVRTLRASSVVGSDGKTVREQDYFRNVAGLALQAAEALQHAHELGVVHRDIKPSNLMIDGSGHLWVTDFGLAQTQSSSNLTLTGDVIGTLRYMSPEQVRGQRELMDHRVDVYSLGITLYELLTWQPAFPGKDRPTLARKISEEEPTLPRRIRKTIPRDLETIVLKSVAKEPSRRYATAQHLADDLRRFLAHEPIRARRLSPTAMTVRWLRRHRVLTTAASVAILVAVLFTLGLVWDRHQRRFVLQRTVGEHLAVAEARIESLDLDAAQHELGQSQVILKTTSLRFPELSKSVERLSQELTAKRNAEQLFEKLLERRHRVYAHLYDLVDQARLDTRKDVINALDQYAVLEDDKWYERRVVTDLGPSERADLDTHIAELLLLLARLEATPDIPADTVPYRAWRIYYVDEAAYVPPNEEELARAYRLALRSITRLEQLQGTSPAVTLWKLEFEKRLQQAEGTETGQLPVKDVEPSTGFDYYAMGEYHAIRGQGDEALRCYEMAVQLQPDHYLALLASGLLQSELGRHELAVATLTAAITVNPRIARPFLARGVARAQLGNSGLAQADFETVLKLEPDLAKGLVTQAQIFGKKRDYDRAIDTCTLAIQLDPQYAAIYAVRGINYDRKREWRQACDDFSASIALDPSDAEVYALRTNALFELGQYEESLADIERALELSPSEGRFYNRKAIVLRQLGRNEEALAVLDRGISADPTCELLYEKRISAYIDANRGQLALEDANRLIELDADSANNYLTRGWVNKALEKFPSAITDFSQAIDLDPSHPEAHYWRGYCRIQTGDIDAAIADLCKAIQLSNSERWEIGELSWAYGDLGLAHLKKGNTDQALKHASQAIEMDPNLYAAYLIRGDTYAKIGDSAHALEDYSAAIKVDPSQSDGYVARARVHNAMGDYQQGVKDCDAALSQAPNRRDVLALRANARASLGKLEEAIADYDRVMELGAANAQMCANRAGVHFLLGQLEEAITCATQAIQKDDQYAHGYYLRGRARMDAKAYREAIEDLERAFELSLQQGGLVGAKQLIQLFTTCKDPSFRDPARAQQIADELVQLGPEYSPFREYLGIAQFYCGEYQAAIQSLNKARALSQQPDVTSAHQAYLLAVAHFHVQSEQDAQRYFAIAEDLAGRDGTDDPSLQELQVEARRLLADSQSKESDSSTAEKELDE